MRTFLISGAFVALLASAAAHAQSAAIPPVSEAEPTGNSPTSTGSVTATGRTKPPGAPVGEGLGTRPDLEKRAEELDRRIRTGICRGC